uniref:Uncharacterized protein n=1 Tax=Cacopsylla melanoneura TaxID=428564 RepID=A0A8D9AYW8_9HEMI
MANQEELMKISEKVDKQMQEFNQALLSIKKSLKPGDSNPALVSLGLLEMAFNSFRDYVQGEFGSLGKRMANIEVNQDAAEAYSRRNCLLLFGLKEDAKNEEEVEKLVLQVFQSKLQLDIQMGDIDRAHRLGRVKDAGKPRPIIVKFVSYRARRLCFSNKSKLKGEQISIGESLTKKRLAILNKARDTYGVVNCWTSDGKILVKEEVDGVPRRHVFTTMEQLESVQRPSRQRTNEKDTKKPKEKTTTGQAQSSRSSSRIKTK